MASIKKSGLGKGIDSMGIDALIPSKSRRIASSNSVKEENENVSRETLININLIEPNKEQPRKVFNDDALQELADSIKQIGIIQPIILQKREKYYEIIAGERRWRAAKLAGLKEVPAIVKDYTEKEIVEIALIENIQREDLNPIEEALAYQKLVKEFNLKQDEVAERVAKSRVAITNSMRLLKLDKRVQEMIIEEMISSGHARALLAIENGELQYQLATKIFDEKLNVRDTESLVKKVLYDLENPQEVIEQEDTSNIDAIFKDMEENIKNIIGSKVSIKRKSNDRGKIEISYFNQEELERIYDMLKNLKN